MKKKDSIETPVGYAWMPILHDGRCVGAGVVCGVRASVVRGLLFFLSVYYIVLFAVLCSYLHVCVCCA